MPIVVTMLGVKPILCAAFASAVSIDWIFCLSRVSILSSVPFLSNSYFWGVCMSSFCWFKGVCG